MTMSSSSIGELSDTKKVLLDLLKVFKMVCKKHNLRYFAIGGTCIGAIRHKGFIPWDDDMDVGMPYEDFLKFREIARCELPDGYDVYCPTEHKYMYYNAIFLHNTNTASIDYIWKDFPECYKGISIDILPVMGTPKGIIMQKLFQLNIAYVITKNRMLKTPLEFQAGIMQKTIWRLFNMFQNKGNEMEYMKKIENKFKKIKFDNSDMVIFAWLWRSKTKHANWTNHNMFCYKLFADEIEVPFEDTTICVPVGYDEYLTKDYNNYMEIPPLEYQTAPHDKFLEDVHVSYNEYINKLLLR